MLQRYLGSAVTKRFTEPYLVPPSLCAPLAEHYEDTNERLRRKYFPDHPRRLFSAPEPAEICAPGSVEAAGGFSGSGTLAARCHGHTAENDAQWRLLP